MAVKKKKLCNKLIKIDAKSMKKPSALDKIIETIPKPKGAIPNFGLPRWKLMELESKIPMIPGPDGAYNLTRQKLGRNLWIQTKNADFNLSDPFNYEIQYSYDSLHDQHLAGYFSRKINIQRLQKLGLVTKELDAICSLKDYNVYRKFLRKLHSDDIKRELKRRGDLVNEKRILEFADFAAKREFERLKIAERKAEAKTQLEYEKRKEKERQKEAEMLRKQLEAMETAKKKEKLEKRQSILKAQAEYIREKRTAAAEKERRKIIDRLVAWRNKECERKRVRKERLNREAEEKREHIQNKWEYREKQQIQEIAKRKLILQCAEERRETFITNYTKKVKKERTRAQKRFKKIQRFVRCYINREALSQNKQSCCKDVYKQKKIC